MNIFHVSTTTDRPLTETERGVSDARCAATVRNAINAALADHAERLQRPMTAVEADAVAEAERAALRKDARHAHWLACRDAKPGEVVGGE